GGHGMCAGGMEGWTASEETLRLPSLPVRSSTWSVLRKRGAASLCTMPCPHVAEKKCMVVNELQNESLPVFALRGHTVFGTGNLCHNRTIDMHGRASLETSKT